MNGFSCPRSRILGSAALLAGAFVAVGCAGHGTSDNPPTGTSSQTSSSNTGDDTNTSNPNPSPDPNQNQPQPSPPPPGDDTSTPGACPLNINASSIATFDGICVPAGGPMIVDATSIIVLEQSSQGILVRIDRATGTATTLVGKGGDPSAAGSIADGGDQIFFNGCTTSIVGVTSCGIYGVPRTGDAVRSLTSVDSQAIVSSIAANAENVYYVADADLWTVPRAGGNAKKLLPNAATIDRGRPSLALDATSVYMTSPDDGTVKRVPFDGSAPTMIASGEITPSEIRIVGTSVYWLDQGQLGVDCTPVDGSLRLWNGGEVSDVTTRLAGATSFDVAGDGHTAVFSTLGSYCNQETASGGVQELSSAGASPITLAANLLLTKDVTVVGDQVFWMVESSWDGAAVIMQASLQ